MPLRRRCSTARFSNYRSRSRGVACRARWRHTGWPHKVPQRLDGLATATYATTAQRVAETAVRPSELRAIRQPVFIEHAHCHRHFRTMSVAAVRGPVPRLWAALLEAAAGDREVAQWCTQLETGRRTTIVELLELVYGRPPDERTVDIVWSLVSIETYTKLCLDRGWTIEQWQEWAVEAIQLFAGRP
jgi:hypothetical protein